jgi:hypothetical protein
LKEFQRGSLWRMQEVLERSTPVRKDRVIATTAPSRCYDPAMKCLVRRSNSHRQPKGIRLSRLLFQSIHATLNLPDARPVDEGIGPITSGSVFGDVMIPKYRHSTLTRNSRGSRSVILKRPAEFALSRSVMRLSYTDICMNEHGFTSHMIRGEGQAASI